MSFIHLMAVHSIETMVSTNQITWGMDLSMVERIVTGMGVPDGVYDTMPVTATLEIIKVSVGETTTHSDMPRSPSLKSCGFDSCIHYSPSKPIQL